MKGKNFNKSIYLQHALYFFQPGWSLDHIGQDPVLERMEIRYATHLTKRKIFW